MKLRPSLLALMAVITACGFAGTVRAEEEMVANPAYATWAKYKPGTAVTLKSTTEMTGLPAAAQAAMAGRASTVTRTLESVADDKVVVTVKFEGAGGAAMRGGGAAGGAGSKIEIPAKIAKSKVDSTMTQGVDAKVTNVKDGTDKIEVGGKSYDVKTKEMDIEMTMSGREIKAHNKMWLSEEVPGGMVKMTSEGDTQAAGAAVHRVTTTTLEKFELGK